MTESLRRDVENLLRDTTLFEWQRLVDRVAATETCSLLLDTSVDECADDDTAALKVQAKELLDAIRSHDSEIVARFERRMASGRFTGNIIARELLRYSNGRPGDSSMSFAGLDGADWLISKVFQLEDIPLNKDPEHPEMIQLEYTPVRALLHFAKSYPWSDSDVLVDIGCGPGTVVLLINLIRKIRTIGVDIEPAYIRHAVRIADRFKIRTADFIAADARHADLSEGTVFYLFTPFVGRIQRSMFRRLEEYAGQRRITVCTYGSITAIAEKEPWLARGTPQAPGPYTIAWYQSAG